MRLAHLRRIGQIGDRACYPSDTVESPSGQPAVAQNTFYELDRFGSRRHGIQLRPPKDSVVLAAPSLALSRKLNPTSHILGSLTWRPDQRRRIGSIDPNPHVEPVDEWARQSTLISLEHSWRAPARLTLVSEIPTGAWIGRGNELNRRREANAHALSGDGDVSALERLAERIEETWWELT